jgi:hypothetical protein
MARNDPYLPDFATVSGGGSVVFDGSQSGTGEAIINEVAGNFDVNISIEESNNGGSSFTEVTKLATENGNLVFAADFHSQFNRIYVSQNERRLRISDATGTGGEVSVTGDER